jgi:hypothetical protein
VPRLWAKLRAHSRGHRRRLRSPEQHAAFLELCRTPLPWRAAAERVDASLSTVFRWRHAHLQRLEEEQRHSSSDLSRKVVVVSSSVRASEPGRHSDSTEAVVPAIERFPAFTAWHTRRHGHPSRRVPKRAGYQAVLSLWRRPLRAYRPRCHRGPACAAGYTVPVAVWAGSCSSGQPAALGHSGWRRPRFTPSGSQVPGPVVPLVPRVQAGQTKRRPCEVGGPLQGSG